MWTKWPNACLKNSVCWNLNTHDADVESGEEELQRLQHKKHTSGVCNIIITEILQCLLNSVLNLE